MPIMVGTRIRQARTARHLSLSEVASRAKISVATLSRVERHKQGLELGLFLTLCRVLKTSPQDLLGGEEGDNVDPLAVRISALDHSERVHLWQDLAASRRNDRRQVMRNQMRRLAEEVEELLAQLEFVRAEIESVHKRVARR